MVQRELARGSSLATVDRPTSNRTASRASGRGRCRMSERSRICIPWPRRPPSTGQGGSAGCRPPRQSQRRNAGGAVLRRHVCGGPSRFIIMQLGGSGAGLGWCVGGTPHNPARAAIAEGSAFVRAQELSEPHHRSLSQLSNRNPISFRMAWHASETNSGTGTCLYRNKGNRKCPRTLRIKSSSVRFGLDMPRSTLRVLCASRSRLLVTG
jgi:hypothetical protein